MGTLSGLPLPYLESRASWDRVQHSLHPQLSPVVEKQLDDRCADDFPGKSHDSHPASNGLSLNFFQRGGGGRFRLTHVDGKQATFHIVFLP